MLGIHLVHAVVLHTKLSVSFSRVCMQQNEPKQMSNPKEMTDTVGTNPDLFSIHAEVPAKKDKARNLSCPLSYCNRPVHFIKLCIMRLANGPKHIANAKRKDQGGRWNQSIPLLFTCGSTHKQEGSSRSFEFMRNCNTSGCFIQPCALVGDGPKHIFNSKRKDQQGC